MAILGLCGVSLKNACISDHLYSTQNSFALNVMSEMICRIGWGNVGCITHLVRDTRTIQIATMYLIHPFVSYIFLW